MTPEGYKSQESPPRVRIAPSPTGKLHLGTARTALFNWLFARKYGGVFILRIEDTDLERSTPAYEQDILDNLKWLGIGWDEGIGAGGDYGPYRQSERSGTYAVYIERLLKEGAAYHCFCSEEELEAERQAMIAKGLVPRYGGRCSDIALGEAAERVKRGERSVIRLRMPRRRVIFNDIIRGKIEFDTELIGDIVIAKEPTIPLYNFAVVIDDYEMKITHVLRGEDHLSNTPKQWIIADFLKLPHPEYGHFPLILGPDRSKLSKRHGATSVSDYKEAGYLPEALVNFMALLGWHSKEEREIFTLSELIEEFSPERIQKSGAVFDIARLDWLNGHYIRQKSDKELLEAVLPYWKAVGYLKGRGGGEWKEEKLLAILALEKERIKTLKEIVPSTEYFFRDELSYEPGLLVWKKSTPEETRKNLLKIIGVLQEIPDTKFSEDSIEERLEPFFGQDRGKILWPLRAALSGRAASPGPYEMAEILGNERTLARLKYAAELLSKSIR